MPFTRLWIHMVWATKDRQPYLQKPVREQVIRHLRGYGAEKSIHIDHVNGHLEHLHCLLSLAPDQNVSTIANLLKGNSSYWINQQKLTKQKFSWQEEYFAVSVSHSQVQAVRSYIRNQEEHHRKKTFQQEYDEFMRKYEFEGPGW